jgi:hypothetical protein
VRSVPVTVARPVANCRSPARARAYRVRGNSEYFRPIAEAGEHPILSPEAWWSAVLGSGYRGTLDQIDTVGQQKVRTANLAYIHDSGITSVEANVVYAIATKK